MLTTKFVISSAGPGRNGRRAILQAVFLLFIASNSQAETYDPIPIPYCNILYDPPADYGLLESEVTGSNPKATALAQFVLEAFAQANANNGLLESASKNAVVTALNRLQAMWVASALNFKERYADSSLSDDNTIEFVLEPLVQIPYRFPKLLAQYGPVNQSGTIASQPVSGHAVIAFWTRTGYCADTSTRFNAFRAAFTSASVRKSYNPTSGAVSLSVPGWKNTLSIDANAITETTTTLAGGDIDSAFTPPLLNVNGTEYLSKTVQEWKSQDIGDAAGGSAIQRGSNGFYSGRVQVVGSGSDIWSTADGFQFYYQQLVGNGTIIGRLTNMPTGSATNEWAKAGLMMRNDLTPGSANAFVSLDGKHGQRFSVRMTADHETNRDGNTITTSPYWFKLTRVNDTFTGFTSHDLMHWTQVGSPTTIPMNKTIYAGAAVSSHDRHNLLTTGFDNLGILQR